METGEMWEKDEKNAQKRKKRVLRAGNVFQWRLLVLHICICGASHMHELKMRETWEKIYYYEN